MGMTGRMPSPIVVGRASSIQYTEARDARKDCNHYTKLESPGETGDHGDLGISTLRLFNSRSTAELDNLVMGLPTDGCINPIMPPTE